MKNFFKSSLLIVALMCMLTSCDDKGKGGEDGGEGGNGNGKETTVAEDKANIQASFDNVKNLIRNFRNGSIYQFAEEFAGIGTVDEEYEWYSYVGEGRGDYSWSVEMWDYEYTPGAGNYVKVTETDTYFGANVPEMTEIMSEKLADVISFEQIEDQGRFNFASISGKYTWNNSSEKWDKTSLNTVQLLFPSTASSTTNNCEFSITEYTDKGGVNEKVISGTDAETRTFAIVYESSIIEVKRKREGAQKITERTDTLNLGRRVRAILPLTLQGNEQVYIDAKGTAHAKNKLWEALNSF